MEGRRHPPKFGPSEVFQLERQQQLKHGNFLNMSKLGTLAHASETYRIEKKNLR